MCDNFPSLLAANVPSFSSMGIHVDGRMVRVLKLNPPERGQTTLNMREN